MFLIAKHLTVEKNIKKQGYNPFTLSIKTKILILISFSDLFLVGKSPVCLKGSRVIIDLFFMKMHLMLKPESPPG